MTLYLIIVFNAILGLTVTSGLLWLLTKPIRQDYQAAKAKATRSAGVRTLAPRATLDRAA